MIDPSPEQIAAMKVFPIMCGERVADHKSWIPWAVIAPHEAQARSNHSQTLERLAERGGLAPCEAVAVLEDRKWRQMPQHEARLRLGQIVAAALLRLPRVPLAANLGADTPWPLSEVLTRLADAADHLLRDHDCDTHGWEGITVARDTARRYAADLAQPPLAEEGARRPPTLEEKDFESRGVSFPGTQHGDLPRRTTGDS